MIKNYIKTAWRMIWSDRKYALLNTIGLTLGLAVFMTILVYINREQSYDRWDPQLSRVYRHNSANIWDREKLTSFSPSALSPFLRQNMPEVESATTIAERGETVITVGREQFYDKQIIGVDSAFFQVFPYRFVQGDRTSALSTPNAAVITEELAKKWFGHSEALGQVFKVDERESYTVTGVVEKTAPSHLDFNICLSMRPQENNWNTAMFFNYILLWDNVEPTVFESKLRDYYAQNIIRSVRTMKTADGEFQMPIIAVRSTGEPIRADQKISGIQVSIEPVQNIHLRPETYPWRDSPANHPINDYEAGNHIPVTVFAILALVVLILACINYITLAIAQGHKRAKASGLRKIAGASRWQIIALHLTQSFILVLTAIVLSLIVSSLLINTLNQLFGLDLHLWSSINQLANRQLILQIILIALGVTILSGGYPALLISAYKPVSVLKGELASGSKGLWLRNTLVVLQFTIAIAFTASLIVMSNQIDFMQRNDPGFNGEQVLRINGEGVPMDYGQSLDQDDFLMNSMRNLPEVKALSATDFYPGQPSLSIQTIEFGSKNDTLTVRTNRIGLDYFKTLGSTIVQGRDFSPQYAMDTINSAIINQTAAKAMGIKEPLGSQIMMDKAYTIVGVVQDTYNAGYTETITPEVYVNWSNPNLYTGRRQLLVKLHSGKDAQQAVKKIEKIWKSVDTAKPMRYSWLDNDFASLMEKYIRFGKLISMLTAVTLCIAIMGVLTLSAYAAQQRTKEIGIRKVLGASISGIVRLLSMDFVKMVVVAILVASPIAWWAMSKWLEDFAYRIDVQWWMFALAGALALIVALLSVSGQAIRAARVNPVDSLRDE